MSITLSSTKVLRSYYAISGIYTLSASLIWGVNTLFLLDAGLDILEVFIANSAYTVGMMIFEIPTGVVADTAGRRVSFLASLLVLSLGTAGYVAVAFFEGGLTGFIITSVILGLGFTFYSGAVEAWVVDALKTTDYKGSLDRVFSRGAMISGTAMLVGTVSGGFLGSLDLTFPYIGRVVLLALVFLVAFFTMKEIGFVPRSVHWRDFPREMMIVARTSLRYGWQDQRVRLLMMTSFVQMSFLAWGFYAWQPYFLELLGKNAVWVAGVVAALVSLSSIAGNALSQVIIQYSARRSTILLWAAALATLASIGVGLTDNFWLAVSLWLFVMFCLGLSGPVKQALLHRFIPSEQRATVVSFDSMVGSTGGVMGYIGLGQIAKGISIGMGYVVGGTFTVIALPLLTLLRRRCAQDDFITPEEDVPETVEKKDL